MQSNRELERAKAAVQREHFAEARAVLQNLLEEDTENIEAWLLLARVSLEREEAVWCLNQVLALAPGNPIATKMLSQFMTTNGINRLPNTPRRTYNMSTRKMKPIIKPSVTFNTPELLLGPIIGGLTHTSVRFWGRASSPAILYAWLKEDSSGEARLAGQTDLTPESGNAGAIEVNSLAPSTQYRYALTLKNNPPELPLFLPFKTAPHPGQNVSFQFVFGSCFRPTKSKASGRIFKQIQEAHTDLSFLMMLGDQIYSDDWKHNGLDRVAVKLDEYREVYLHAWSNPFLKELLSHTPVFMMMDDHEVDNDWHWRDEKRKAAEIPLYTKLLRWLANRPVEERRLSFDRVQAALQAYWEHQGTHISKYVEAAPFTKDAFHFNVETSGSFAYTFEFGAAAFFVLDTRTQRICYDTRKRKVLGEDQWQALEQWLLAINDTAKIKFIVTSSAFLNTLLGDFANDRWSSYPEQRNRLLKFIIGHRIRGLYILTGDLHSGHAISANLIGESGQVLPVWEFCSSPFEQDTNFLAKYLTLRHPVNKLMKDYRVHFIVDKPNYGVVTVYLNDPSQPSVHFDLHYYARDGSWKSKSVSHVHQ